MKKENRTKEKNPRTGLPRNPQIMLRPIINKEINHQSRQKI